MNDRIITFTTDYATEDGYVGAVRGVILSICPTACIVDISHQIPPQDVGHAAFALHTSVRYFPKNTIHLAVVDPGVGSQRRALCVLTDDQILVGPDNGIFSTFLDEAKAVYSIEETRYFRDAVSATFHGRDIFGPVAAHLACGISPDKLGPLIDDPLHLLAWTNRRAIGRLEGAVVHIDHFGNCITSLSVEDLSDFNEYTVWITGNAAAPETSVLSSTFADALLGDPCWYIGSMGLIELAVNGGSAANLFGIERGDLVLVEEKDKPA